MFNIDSSVELGEFAEFGKVVRNARFFGVAKIPSSVPARLVPITTMAHLQEALDRLPDIAGVICPTELAASVPEQLGCLTAADPQGAAFRIHSDLTARTDYYWTSFPTKIGVDCVIHPGAQIAEYNVEIGANTVIDRGAIIHERTLIGEGCRIGSGTVIGTSAFELASIDGRNELLPQAGGVRIGRHSIFLSGGMVARSAFAAFTEIGENCAFDNLVHIAHDCVIEGGSQVTAGGILAGRVTLRPDSFVGPNATISNGLSVGEGSSVTIGSTVVRDVEAGKKVTGYFATEHREFLRALSRGRS